MFSGIMNTIHAFDSFVETLSDFTNTFLPDSLSVPIMLVVGIMLALAGWRIIT